MNELGNVLAYMIIADFALINKGDTSNKHDCIEDTKTHSINWSFTRGKDDFYKSLVYDLQPVNLQRYNIL